MNVKVVKQSLLGKKILMDEIEYSVHMVAFLDYKFKKKKIKKFKKANDTNKQMLVIG
ncbi:MAG: hypothetical protein ACFFFB_05045 [Candidatus Heimdallarchaeota archaeon]